MNFASSKRKRDEFDPDLKKVKNLINEQDKAEYTTSNEWPVYAHPEGGIVKITPWGSLRQFTNTETGQQIAKFEDVSFSDISFDTSNTDDIYNPMNTSLPSTPQSLYNQNMTNPSNQCPTNTTNNYNASARHPHHPQYPVLSVDDEVESYVVDGYHQITPPPPSSQEYQKHSFSNDQQEQFEQEQENYFGMMDGNHKEEYEYNEDVVRHYNDGDVDM
ncbi:uncharacterized protein RJT21DRAFT_121561 [Scheffersomyces amazonensis]|uniref:uncharacterized protein n=1 Tax=Scheffersomyces amazonensis TaxID=1078765 RepID=UPI00315DA0C4